MVPPRRPALRRIAACSLLVLLFALSCRIDGLVRFSVDLAEELPGSVRRGSFSSSSDSDDGEEIEPGDMLSLYFFPELARILGDHDDDVEIPAETKLGAGVILDIPGGSQALEAVDFGFAFDVKNSGVAGIIVNPSARIYVAPMDSENVFDDSDDGDAVLVGETATGNGGDPEKVATGESRSITFDETVARNDHEFDIIATGEFRVGLVVRLELGIDEDDGDGDNGVPDEISWDLKRMRLRVSARPYRLLE